MKEQAIHYYNDGYNCSQCIIKATEAHFNISVNEQCYCMLDAVNTGFGCGIMCGMLVAAVMIFGLMFDENTAKKLRLEFLSEFKEKHKCFDCALLQREQHNSACEELIGDTAAYIQSLIEREQLIV